MWRRCITTPLQIRWNWLSWVPVWPHPWGLRYPTTRSGWPSVRTSRVSREGRYSAPTAPVLQGRHCCYKPGGWLLMDNASIVYSTKCLFTCHICHHTYKNIFFKIMVGQFPSHHGASLGPSDIIWREGYWSTLTQVMACCLMAPSHNLNQYWLENHGFQPIPVL